MGDERKTKKQLLEELEELRLENARLSRAASENQRVEGTGTAVQERLEFLITSGPAVLYASRPSGDYGATYISPNVKDQLGYRPEDFVEDPGFWASHIHPEDSARVFEGMEDIFKRGRHVHEYRFRHQDGSYRWMLDEVILVRDQDGHPLEMVGYWIDITDRKQAEAALQEARNRLEIQVRERTSELQATSELLREEIREVRQAEIALRESEEKYRLVVENASEAIFVNQDGVFKYLNPRAEELTGYAEDELISRPFIDLVHPDDLDTVTDRHQKRQDGLIDEEVYSFRIVSRDGRTKWIEAKSVRFTWEGWPATVNLVTDITERKLAEEAFRESEKHFRALVESSTDSILTLDSERRITDCNPAFQYQFGFDREEIVGQSVAMIHPSRKSFVEFGRIVYPAIERNGYFKGEWQLMRKDGKAFPVETVTSIIRGSDDKAKGYVAIIRDITERKKHEEDLRASEERFRSVYITAPLAFVIWDRDTKVIDWNTKAEELFGWSKKEVVGRSFFDFIIPDKDRTHVESVVSSLLNDELPSHSINNNLTKDGKVITCEWNNSILHDEQGNVTGAISLALDITDRKRAEEALRESERRLLITFDEAPIGAALTDPKNLRFIRPNNQFCRFLGYTEAELQRLTFRDITHPEDLGKDAESIQRLRRGEIDQYSREKRYLRKDGQEVWGRLSVSLVRDDAGTPLYFIPMVEDITERKTVEEALKKNERWLKTILDSIQAAVVVHGPDTNIVLANPKARELLGQTEKQLIGKEARDPAWTFVREDGRPLTVAEYPVNLVFAKARPLRGYVGGIYRPDKQGTKWVTLNADPVLDDQGNVSHVIVTFMDITEQKESADRLGIEKERFQVLSEASPLGITLIDPDDQYNYANPRFVQMFGYDLDEVPNGREWFRRAFPDPKYRRQVVSTWLEDREKAEVGEARPRTYTVSCKDGSEKQIHFRPVSLENGSQLVIYEDVTERKRAEQKLIDSEKRYRDLFQSVNDFIYTHDMEGRLLTVNPASARILGYIPEEMTGRPISDFMLPQYRKAFRDEYLPQIKRQKVFNGVSVFLSKDGTRRYIEYRNTLAQPGGQEPFISGVGRDITERVLAERDLKEMEGRLAHAQKMEAVGTLASGIAHDFNNLLQAISGFLELVQNRKITRAKMSRYLSEAENATERAGELVRRLLTFSRRMERELEPVDLNQGVRQAVKLLERTIPKMIRIKTSLDRNLKMTNGDPTQVEQIIMNLGANARDAMPDGGELIIQTDNVTLDEKFCQAHPDLEPGEYIRLTMTDSGQGMDQEILDRIFEPFFTTKGVGHGTGLGLSTVYGIVKSYGGIIACRSQLDHGTTFDIYLPALEASVAEVASEVKTEADIHGGDETILVVDDDPSILGVAEAILAEYGYTTFTADSGEQALGFFNDKADEIDLVVLDLNMPGMGGHACLEELIRLDPKVKVLVASGYASDGIEKQVREAGARGYIAKPYRLTDLVLGVREILDED